MSGFHPVLPGSNPGNRVFSSFISFYFHFSGYCESHFVIMSLNFFSIIISGRPNQYIYKNLECSDEIVIHSESYMFLFITKMN
jgi:hypothetical protein